MTDFEETVLDRLREIAFALDKLALCIEEVAGMAREEHERWEPTAYQYGEDDD